MRIGLPAVGLMCAVSWSACDSLPDVDCSGTVPAFEDVTALEKCSSCHSSKLSGSARRDAPKDVNFDTKSAAEHSAEDAASEVTVA